MKLRITCLLAALFVALTVQAATTDELIAQGRTALVNSNIVAANNSFKLALGQDPNNAEANFLQAATGLLLLPRAPGVTALLDYLQVSKTGRNLYDWTAKMPTNSDGSTRLPADLNSHTGIVVYTTTVVPAVRAAQTNLSRITDTNVLIHLSLAETQIRDADVDYGDIQLLRAMLYGFDALGHTVNAHNFDVAITTIRNMSKSKTLTFQSLLSTFTNLFALRSQAELRATLPPFTNAIGRYLDASTFIHGRSDTQTNRLFNLSPDQLSREQIFHDNASNVLESVDHPVVFDFGGEQHVVYLGAYFGSTTSIRSKLLKFNGNRYVYNSLPDYSFGGILPDLPAVETEAILREALGRPAPGVYMGTMQGYDFNSGVDFSGEFALFIRTNGSASFIAVSTDSDEQQVYADASFARHNSLSFNTNGIDCSGDIGKDGHISGDLNSSHGYAYFDGDFVPDSGVLQDQAGFYTGTYAGGSVGTLRGVMSSDGHVIFASWRGTEVGNGGVGDVDSTDNSFTFTTGSGDTTGQGTLNPGLHKINGNWQNSSDNRQGTFVLTRSSSVPVEVPPFLTDFLPVDVVGTRGDAVSFTAHAAGSAPLAYQWSFNDTPILGATSSTLILPNVSDADVGTYSVFIQNLAGATNDTAILVDVGNEQVPPAVKIVSPAPLARTSNDVATIIGTATDNMTVTQVFCTVDGGAPLVANGTDRWTNLVPVGVGTNLIRAYALDSSGNQSTNNASVSIVRLAADRLDLRITGKGTLSPNLSNKVVLVNASFSITASPSAGFVFSNWTRGDLADTVLTNGRTLRFTMESNLVLTANFVTNPFTPVKGTYNGLFTADPRQQNNSGFFSMTVDTNGSGSGSLRIGSSNKTFVAKFDLFGNATNTLTIPQAGGTNPLTLSLNLDLHGGGNVITGQLQNPASSWTANVTAYRAIFNSTTHPATAFSNRYTVVIFGDGTGLDPNAIPGGDSYASLTVSKAGSATLSGKLSDNFPISQTVAIAEDGDIPMYIPLNSGKGSLYGWLHLNGNPATNVSGNVSWIRPPLPPSSKIYTNGFNFDTTALGEVYKQPAAGVRVIAMTSGIAYFSGPDVPAFTNTVFLTTANTMTNTPPSANGLAFSLIKSNGFFTGTVFVPNTLRRISYQGIFLQQSGEGFGFFPGTNTCGEVLIGPADVVFPPPPPPAAPSGLDRRRQSENP